VNAETFNALYEVGIPVFAYPGARPKDDRNARRIVTRTRSKATVLGGHTDVVWVDDHSACIALSRVDVVTEDEWKAAQTAEAVADRGALPMPAGPARLSDDLLADYAALDFAELMEPEAATVVTSVCDPLVAEIKRLREELDRARGRALREAADWFESLANSEPEHSYRARVMRGAANDIRRLATSPTTTQATEAAS
jgi:hypothetical protein